MNGLLFNKEVNRNGGMLLRMTGNSIPPAFYRRIFNEKIWKKKKEDQVAKSVAHLCNGFTGSDLSDFK